jgi:uncharacterized protein
MLKSYARPLIFALTFLWASIALSQESCFPAHNDHQLVYDEGKLLLPSQWRDLENKLEHFAQETSNQIVVIITDDLCGKESWQYATEVGESWGVGQAKRDNGLVLVVKPKRNGENGEVAIAVGRGLEGAIPDVITKDIQQFEMIPHFKMNDYFTGIDKAVGVLMDLAKSEYNYQDYQNEHKNSSKFPVKIILILIVIVIVIIFKVMRTSSYARTNNMGWWAAWWLLNQTGRSHSGRWTDFTGVGRGGGGGGGFGGFGGFGGGSFGGGGSSSSW